jgi:hypothetical protein
MRTKKLLLVFLLAGINTLAKAQSAMNFLDINRVKAAFWSDGTMFWDKVANPLYEWPQDSGTHISHATGLWLGGVNGSGNLKGAYTRYLASGNDYFPGPLTIAAGSIDSNTMALYDRLWKLNKTEVDQFVLCNCVDPGNPSCAGYSIPASITQWPGNPIVELDGDNLLMDQQLAPYFDANADGVYNPNDCDYPLIKCDQSLFYVFNDRGGAHLESLLPSIGVEIRALAYACSCDSLHPYLEDAIFLDLEMIHRGTDTLYQTYMGLHADADIGGAVDDYFGTHVAEGYVYHYNADPFDNSYNGQQGYGSIPPAQAIIYLQGPLMNANGVADFWDPAWDPNSPPVAAVNAILNLTDTTTANPSFGINGIGFNDAVVDNEQLGLTRTTYPINYADPVPGNDYYKSQRTFWYDGTAQVFGGNGYPAGAFAGASREWFSYSSNSDPYNWGAWGIAPSPFFLWSEYNTGGSPVVNPPGDRRSISASGPFTLMPGEVNKITYGFVSARATTMADSLSLSALHQSVLTVKSAYLQGLNGCGLPLGVDELAGEYRVALYPNPATDIVWLKADDLGIGRVKIFDLSGRLVQVNTIADHQSTMAISLDTFSPGVYIVVIENETGKTSLRMIRQ